MYAQFAAKAGLADDATLKAVVDAVHAIPYGRPAVRSADGVIQGWRGTCSTKHALLMALLRERWPVLRPRLIHRVYRVDTASVLARYGPAVAAAVPEGGLTDVHRYMAISLGVAEVALDVTFPADARWDGRSSMPLACGDGQDFGAGNDPDADKASLEAEHCDPRRREPFIAALAGFSAASGG